jgi:hypothetical protein
MSLLLQHPTTEPAENLCEVMLDNFVEICGNRILLQCCQIAVYTAILLKYSGKKFEIAEKFW